LTDQTLTLWFVEAATKAITKADREDYCDLEWEMVYQKIAGIYAITLKKDGKSLTPFKSDEEPAAAAAPVALPV
jgi:hypothetical protein